MAEAMNSDGKPDSENVNSLEIKIKKKEEVCVSEELGELGCVIEEGIGKVCLTSGDGNDIGQETNNLEVGTDDVNEIDTVEEDESSSSSSSSSSSGSSSDDDEDESDEVEMEEGEIRTWSDDGDEDDIVKDPIRSMNEVQDLPPVSPVTVTIEPHHQTLPVGVVLSIMGSQVIVEGVEDHNPLNEGSILWVTESRTPLGVVDEIFGPVKNPYYIVRFNSETEIPTGIQQGSMISFVPEFADHVLNSNNSLYKKGYDASGDNDEECSEELEFSDDEKEAEYKRMIKMSKRGSSGVKNARIKKGKKSRNRGGNWKNDHQLAASSQVNVSSSGPTTGPHAFSQAPNYMPSGVLPHTFSSIQPQNIGFTPNGFPSNAPPFMQQNFIQQPVQNIGVPNLAPFNFIQGNYGAFASWPSGVPQNNFNQLQAGLQMMFPGLPLGIAIPNGFQMENNNSAVRPLVSGETSQNPDQGDAFSNHVARKPLQRGRGGFRGGPRFR